MQRLLGINSTHVGTGSSQEAFERQPGRDSTRHARDPDLDDQDLRMLARLNVRNRLGDDFVFLYALAKHVPKISIWARAPIERILTDRRQTATGGS